MVEFRFYLFTLISVFLALGTGMFIGSALPGSEALVEKQDAVKAQIQREFDGLRQRERVFAEQVTDLQEEVRAGNLFASSVLPILVQGRLAGRRIGVVATRDTSYPTQVVATLRQAGAAVSQVNMALPAPGGRPSDGERAQWREEGARLAEELLLEPGDEPPGGTPVPLSGVVILAHPGDQAPLIQALADGLIGVVGPRGINLAGGESRDTRPSLVPAYMKLGISTVDDADLLSGQVALVMLLAGGQGHYGIKETARGVLPLPPTAQGEARP